MEYKSLYRSVKWEAYLTPSVTSWFPSSHVSIHWFRFLSLVWELEVPVVIPLLGLQQGNSSEGHRTRMETERQIILRFA